MPHRENGRAISMDSTQPVEADWEDTTNPDTPNAVTNKVLLKAILRLEGAVSRLASWVRWLAVSVVALGIVGALVWWSSR